MIELEDRLRNYRTVLDDAIAERADELEGAPLSPVDAPSRNEPGPSANRVWLFAAAALVLLIGGFVVVAQRQATSTSGGEVSIAVHYSDDVGSLELDPVPAIPVVTPAPTTVPAAGAPVDALAIGDSVMLGAAPELQDRGFTVDATESRAFVNGLDVLLALAEGGRLGDVVVVHLGTNGPIGDADLDRAAMALGEVPNVVFVTNDLPASYNYAEGNNELIRALPERWPNVTVLDWANLAGMCPGDCLYDDQIHLRPVGQEYYADLVAGAVGGGS
ncbi:MAG: hypothetical protein AAFY28_21635 [Actinomycetota bacterium]